MFTAAGGYGHLHPMVPLARAVTDAGHAAAFATVKELCPRIERAGFTAFPAGIGGRALGQATRQRFPDIGSVPPERQLEHYLARMSAGTAAPAMAADLAPIIDTWRPDVVIHEPSEFGGPVAAARSGLPWACHGWGPLFPPEAIEAAAEMVAPLWEESGLPVPPLAGISRYLFFDLCPPSLQPLHARALAGNRPLRPVPFDAVDGDPVPPWVSSLGSPTVYVSLGTLFNESGQVFAAILEGLRGEAFDVVVTVGNQNDPADLGPQPANVHVARYVPQSLLLARCSVVVTHGGAGTVLAALGHGLPLLVLPQGADQFDHAARCVGVGAARALSPEEISPEAVRSAVGTLLSDPRFGEAAGAVREEILAMPGPAEAVGLLEHLANDREALVTGRV